MLTLLIVPMYMFSPKELAPNEDQGVVFGAIDVPRQRDARAAHALHRGQVNGSFQSTPEFDHSFQITFPTGGFGGMLVKPWDERKRTIFPIQAGGARQAVDASRASARRRSCRRRCPSAGTFPVEFVIASTASHEEMLRFAEQLVAGGDEERAVRLPAASPTCASTRPRREIVIDRDKVASMGLSMQQVGADLSAMLGGNFVNRFNIDGRSYKVISADRARRRGSRPSSSSDIYITGPNGQLMPLSAVATLQHGRRAAHAQPLPAAQRGQDLGRRAALARRRPAACSRTPPRKILPPGYRVDYTGESRQLRQEGGKFLPAMGLALVLIFLVLAAQFNSFRDPFVILAGSVPLAMFGALIFTFLKFAGPPGMHFTLTEGWTTTLNIYSQVGLVTLVGLVSKNGILIVEFANAQQRAGHEQARRGAARPPRRACAPS